MGWIPGGPAATGVYMNRLLGVSLRSLKGLAVLVWRAFRKSPLLFQWLVCGAAIGATVVGALVGNMGLAAMGTAVGISGVAAGAVLGLLTVYIPWATARVMRRSREK